MMLCTETPNTTTIFVLTVALLFNLKLSSASTNISIINKCLFTFAKHSYIILNGRTYAYVYVAKTEKSL